jgi:hypothetical protein
VTIATATAGEGGSAEHGPEETGRIRQAEAAAAAALAAAAAVKSTVLPVTLALLLLLPSRLSARGGRRLGLWAGSAAVALSVPAAWALRQSRGAGLAGVHPHLARRLDPADVLRYLGEFPVADHTFKNFVGLIGWTGTGGGAVRWLQVSGVFLAVFLAAAGALALATAWWTSRTDAAAGPLSRAAGWAPAAAAFVLAAMLFSAGGAPTASKGIVYALVAAAPFLALPRAWTRSDRQERCVFAGLLAVLLFAFFYLFDVWASYRAAGELRATHGRYFFVTLGFLILGFVLPALRLASPGPRRNRIVATTVALLALDELLFYLLRALPFYGLSRPRLPV